MLIRNVKKAATALEFDSILKLRCKILRDPWNQPPETATDEFENLSVNAFIADGNGDAVACGRLQENADHVGQIRFMAVHDNHQGHGLGKLIVAFLEKEAREMGITKVELHARENAVDFYKSCGYTLKEPSYLLWGQIQHFLMEKEL